MRTVIREKLAEILEGKAAFPMAVVYFPQDSDVAKIKATYMKIMADQVRERKPFPMTLARSDSNSARVF